MFNKEQLTRGIKLFDHAEALKAALQSVLAGDKVTITCRAGKSKGAQVHLESYDQTLFRELLDTSLGDTQTALEELDAELTVQ